MEQKCLWETTSLEVGLEFPSLHSVIETDIVVIGGGITGLSTALHLAEMNSPVVVLEAGMIPNGGSGKNVGLVNAGAWIPPDDILKVLGNDNGERVTRMMGEAPGLVFSIIDKYRINCEATNNGTLHLAHNAAGVKDIERRYAQLSRRGAPVKLLSKKESYEYTGSNNVPGALLDTRAGTLNPTAYTRGLARAASQQGAKIYTNSPVTGMTKQGDRWSITTPQGEVKALRVVMATNAYTEDEWNVVKQHFYKAYYFQVASEPLPEAEAEYILPNKQGSWDTKKVLSSIRRDAYGRLLLGTMGSAASKSNSYIAGWANSQLHFYFPKLKKVKWEFTWTGTLGFTPTHTFRIFEPVPGMLAVSGYNGRGVTTGTTVGKGFAHYLRTGEQSYLPLPLQEHSSITHGKLRSDAFDKAFTLYHSCQILRIVS